MQWDATGHAGFTTGTPWLPVNPNYPQINAAAQQDDPGSVLHYYRRLIELRHKLPVVSAGDFTLLLPDDERIWAFTRSLGDTELLVVANLSDVQAGAAVPAAASWAAAELLLSNYPPPPAGEPASGIASIALRPWETRVYRHSGRIRQPLG
jgi:oligo-1,6-glucosidase